MVSAKEAVRLFGQSDYGKGLVVTSVIDIGDRYVMGFVTSRGETLYTCPLAVAKDDGEITPFPLNYMPNWDLLDDGIEVKDFR